MIIITIIMTVFNPENSKKETTVFVLRARRNEKELKVKPATNFKYFKYLLTKKIKTNFKTEKILFNSTLAPQKFH